MSPVCAARALLCALFVAVGGVPSRAVAEPPLPQPQLELTQANLAGVVDPLMENWIDKHKGPGAVVVVVRRDAVVFAKGYGFSDIAARKPFSADATLVRPGSISKLFTAIAVMQLVVRAGSTLIATAISTFPSPSRETASPSRCAVF